jgi:uncharacterized protein YdiU (UPF0061 family)
MFNFDNSYVRELDGLYVFCQPEPRHAPRLIKLNRALAEEIGIRPEELATQDGARVLAGNVVPKGAEPIAQAYAGHQFGNFQPQLGDGRALLLGEVIDRKGCRRDIQLKGCGRTPFSRNGDGKAAVGPMLREYLMGEALYHLGIPATRALAVAATGERVHREDILPGAVLTRVAASHIRIGTFEYFAARGDMVSLRRLADYTIRRHYPALARRPRSEFLHEVVLRLAGLVAGWMGAGFIHGVMNTDNMTLSGETIDFGPCAFLEHYDPGTVFSSIDHHGRYAYGNQPAIAQWNLARFAETLLPLLDDDAERAISLATEAINAFPEHYGNAWLAAARRKLGLERAEAEDAGIARDFLAAMQAAQADYTLAWRRLADAAEGRPEELLSLFSANPDKLDEWLPRWRTRLGREARQMDEIATAMRCANPWLIPRNYLVEQALEAASSNGDLAPFNQLLDALTAPYDERDAARSYAVPATREHTAQYRTFCGT